jgi:hypothetical protein
MGHPQQIPVDVAKQVNERSKPSCSGRTSANLAGTVKTFIAVVWSTPHSLVGRNQFLLKQSIIHEVAQRQKLAEINLLICFLPYLSVLECCVRWGTEVVVRVNVLPNGRRIESCVRVPARDAERKWLQE